MTRDQADFILSYITALILYAVVVGVVNMTTTYELTINVGGFIGILVGTLLSRGLFGKLITVPIRRGLFGKPTSATNIRNEKKKKNPLDKNPLED